MTDISPRDSRERSTSDTMTRGTMTNTTKALVVSMLAGIIGFTVFLFASFSGGGGTAVAKTCQVGERDCLPHVDFVDTVGKAYTPQSLAGKVVVVNFWATWCRPCLKEIPDLSRVYKQYKDQGLLVLGVMIDDPDNQTLLNFQSDNIMEYPVIRLNSDIVASFGANYPNRGWPTTYIYDRTGKQVANHVGAVNAALLTRELAPLLAQK